ncbi:MAG TPA: 4Fe-4S binding protein [Desulfomonilaceae bacterium]|nr:4Fe-4S binding protein [Desulfomonilaceae bacterium]
MTAKKSESPRPKKPQAGVSFYPGWCKKCGNCVEFCPTHALELDRAGYPHLANPEKCISCHLCEKLCPDFAIAVGEDAPTKIARRTAQGPSPGTEGSVVARNHSPERLAQAPASEEEEHE